MAEIPNFNYQKENHIQTQSEADKKYRENKEKEEYQCPKKVFDRLLTKPYVYPMLFGRPYKEAVVGKNSTIDIMQYDDFEKYYKAEKLETKKYKLLKKANRFQFFNPFSHTSDPYGQILLMNDRGEIWLQHYMPT